MVILSLLSGDKIRKTSAHIWSHRQFLARSVPVGEQHTDIIENPEDVMKWVCFYNLTHSFSSTG